MKLAYGWLAPALLLAGEAAMVAAAWMLAPAAGIALLGILLILTALLIEAGSRTKV